MTRRPGLAIATVLLVSACAPTLPHSPVERALIRDVLRVVEAKEQTGWSFDHIAIESVIPDALESACRVSPSERSLALDWIEAEIEKGGGSPARLFRSNGGDLDAVEPLLLLTRARSVMVRSNDLIDKGVCPFWMEEQPQFRGLQGFRGRFLFVAEGGGRFVVGTEGGQFGLGGGGALRLLLGYGISHRMTLLTGIETGGAGRFTEFVIGERFEVPELLIFGAIPLLVRFHQLSIFYEVEAAPLFYFNQSANDARAQLGGRIGVGIGVSRLRVKNLTPSVTFSVNYDLIPAQNGAPPVHQFAAGLRASFALSP